MSTKKSTKKSVNKKVKTLIVSNDDKEVLLIPDKSQEKEVFKKSKDLTNSSKNEDMSDSSDDNNDEPMSPFKNKSDINDNYFMAQSVRSKTSKNSFSKVMQNFDLSEEKFNEIIEKQFVCERKQLIDSYIKENRFEMWFQLLDCGFNVLLYGVGSKRKLIDLFISQCLHSEHHIVVNGFNNEITVRYITSVLNEVIDESISEESKLIDRLKDIDFDLYFVIHSIDLMFATNPKINSFFLQLVLKCKRLRIIGTVDHINSGLLWSTTESNVYNWLWFNVPTFDSYTVEKAFSANASLGSASSKSWAQSLTYSSVKHVYDSLTTNAQKIFLLILNNFVDKNDSNNGITFSDCYFLCRDEFLVNSETTLRAQISEFKDHKLLKLKKGSDGGEVIIVCIDKSVAQKFIDNHK